MKALELGLAPPTPGPKTTLLLRAWARAVRDGASWPEWRTPGGISRQDDFNFVKWVLGDAKRARRVIEAARGEADAALELLAQRACSGRENRSTGGQWHHAVLRAAQDW
jgi:hypothetical protein